jgi:hypothetical protein
MTVALLLVFSPILEFCKYNNMFICNGRMCNDKGVGKFTSKDASVVDYVIGSISFLKLGYTYQR